MLRRVVQALRVGLLLLGICLLIWLPVSWHRALYVTADGYALIVSANGWARLSLRRGFNFPDSALSRSPDQLATGHALLPSYLHDPRHPYVFSGTLPLWLLAFLCLAWPVTSFVIARRRRGTLGFPVEAKADSAVSTVES